MGDDPGNDSDLESITEAATEAADMFARDDDIDGLKAEVKELERTRKTSEAYLFDAYWNDMAPGSESRLEVEHWLVERGLLGEGG